MSRLKKIFEKNTSEILNVYITSGYPNLTDTVPIVQLLDKAGVDIVEIGMPYSDPLADGAVIQGSSSQAIQNGITISIIFDQIAEIRRTVNMPLLLMGYYNQVLQYGATEFFTDAKVAGVDGFILPDLPVEEFKDKYQKLFQQLNLDIVFLVTPQTSEKRVKMLDNSSSGFLYLVSSASTTGKQKIKTSLQSDYFKRINTMKLKNPTLVGFGISDNFGFKNACLVSSGAIVGSAFIKMIGVSTNIEKDIFSFVKNIRFGK